MKSACLALLACLLAAGSAAGKEMVLYRTKNPHQMRLVNSDGTGDRLLFEGDILDRANAKAWEEIYLRTGLRGEDGPSKFWGLNYPEERRVKVGDKYMREYQLSFGTKSERVLIEPWTRARISEAFANGNASHIVYRITPQPEQPGEIFVCTRQGKQKKRVAIGIGAQYADIIDAAMLVEAVVLDGQHRLLHHVGNFLEADDVAPLFAELANHHVIGCKDPQRNLGTVVR